MKTHAIIPIFIPHKGCPNNCVFCNQKFITSHQEPMEYEKIPLMIEAYLSTMNQKNIKTIEIAFFGGSFTGLPWPEQEKYLSIAKRYKDAGKIHKIRLSTRPDYINRELLSDLKAFSVDMIELGIQSFDEDVLARAGRGYPPEIATQSSKLIKEYGFSLGIQLMSGLPGDTYEKSMVSAQKTVALKPEIARIYPTVVIEQTPLFRLYVNKEYDPPTLEESVKTVKDMFLLLTSAGIHVIRVGLKSTDNTNKAIRFHPAFRHLVESEIALDQAASQLEVLLSALPATAAPPAAVTFFSNNKSISNLIGHKKSNVIFFQKKYPEIRFYFKVNPKLSDGCYQAAFGQNLPD